MSRLEELVKDTLRNGIIVRGVTYDKNLDSLVYVVDGFSKSGIAELYCEKDGRVFCRTRYNRIDEIETFNDLMMVAYDWNRNYCDRAPFGWDSEWLPLFKQAGLVETKEVTKTEVKPLFL